MSRVGSPVPMPRFSGLACPPRSCPGYLAVAFRRGGLKTPGGSPCRPQGRGGGGARREVGRSGGSPSDSVTLLPPLPPFPRRRSCGGVDVWSPLWAPVGARPAPPACPISAGRSCRCRSWVPVSFPCFSAPDPFFFSPHTCLVSFLAGRPEATPRSVCSPLSLRGEEGGGRWGTVPSSAPVSSLTPEIPIRLLAVDHSARASMKNAASCEN